MSESTLSLTRAEILQAVGDYFSYGRNQYQWTSDQAAQVTRILRSAERRFYTAWPWSFLRTQLALSIVASTADYDLPDGFGGFPEPYLSYSSNANGNTYPVKETSVAQLLHARQNSNLYPQIQPTLFATQAKTPTGTTGQRFQVLLFPTPVASGTLKGSYYTNPDATTDSLPYAMGGAVYSETLLSCCLAAAELERDKQRGPMAQEYADNLARSVEHDKRIGPKHFGYNSDGSAPHYTSIHFLQTPIVSRNGVPIN